MSDSQTVLPPRVRAFFALPISGSDADALLKVQDQIKARSLRGEVPVRFPRAGQLHLTLRFLGEIPRESVPRLTEVGRQVSERFELPAALWHRLHAFPSLARARVLVAELGDEGQQFSALVELLSEGLRGLGLEPETRRFVPHVTLGRLSAPSSVAAWFRGLELPRERICLNLLRLYRSELSTKGSVHSVLWEAALGKV